MSRAEKGAETFSLGSLQRLTTCVWENIRIYDSRRLSASELFTLLTSESLEVEKVSA